MNHDLATQVEALLKTFDPNQPRAPAGAPGGGQWVDSGGGGGGGGGSVAVPAAARVSLAARTRATLDWARQAGVRAVIREVATSHTTAHVAKQALAFAVGSVLSHGSQMHGSMLDRSVEESIDATVENLALTAKLTAAQARDMLRTTFDRLAALRRAQLASRRKEILVPDLADDDDPILAALENARRLLDAPGKAVTAGLRIKSFGLAVTGIDEAGRFEGYASVFDVVDKVKEKVARGAFAKSLARWHSENRRIKMLWQHKPSEPIGVIDAREDDKGLRVEGTLFKGVRRAEEAIILMRGGAIDELSIGYNEIRAERDGATKVRSLLELELREVSPVTFPALPAARIDTVKHERFERMVDFAARLRDGDPPEIKEFEDILREAGVPRRMAVAIASHGYAKAIRSESEGGEAKFDLGGVNAAIASLRALKR